MRHRWVLPFIVTTAAACGGSQEHMHSNPPPPPETPSEPAPSETVGTAEAAPEAEAPPSE